MSTRLPIFVLNLAKPALAMCAIVLCVGSAHAQNKFVMDDNQFNGWLYQGSGQVPDEDSEVTLMVEAMHRSCHLTVEQEEKLRHCGLDRFVDVLVVSEEVGASKPGPEIFRVALERLECSADEAVMVGDSWAADIAGASRLGIRAVWFNRGRRPAPEPESLIQEIAAFEPVEDAIEVILGSRSPGGPGSS